jgi:hypothetical protein
MAILIALWRWWQRKRGRSLPTSRHIIFYARLLGGVCPVRARCAPGLAAHRAWMSADDNYVDLILYESDSFCDEARYDDVMSRALASAGKPPQP